MSTFYSTSAELCLACSGSALSGSRRPRPINNFRSNSSFSPKERPNNDTSIGSGSTVDSKQLDEIDNEAAKDGWEISIFRTQCCNRPICSACLTSNPRLARYVPCLACLGGVHAVAGPSASSSLKHPISDPNSQKLKQERELDTNLNGALRDRDVFVLGEDDEDDDDDEDYSEVLSGMPSRRVNATPPPAYSASEPAPVVLLDNATQNGTEIAEPGQTPNGDPQVRSTPGSNSIIDGRLGRAYKGAELPKSTPSKTETATKPTPRKHYINKDDTLRGLALRYGVDGRALCRLNNLPPSTLTTTPHLLHTRTTLILPPSAKSFPPGGEESRDYDAEREHQIKLEKTAKRLQLITKETNWDVAKAYAVLAQTSSSSSSGSSSSVSLSAHASPRTNGSQVPADQDGLREPYPEKMAYADEKELARKKAAMQERALDAYLEDDAWESEERAAGRGPPSMMTSAGPSRTKPTSMSRDPKFPAGRVAKTKNSKRFF